MRSPLQLFSLLGSKLTLTLWPSSKRPEQKNSLMKAAATLFVAASLAFAPAAVAKDQHEHWVGTWSASPMSADSVPGSVNNGFSNQTLRHVTHISIGGDSVRVRLSNAYGTKPLVIGAAHIALHNTAATIVAGSDRALTFRGQPSITIPSGALAVSDPVRLDVPALADLAVSIYVPGTTGPTTWHQLGVQTTYVSPPGNFAATTSMPVATTELSRFWLASVEVSAKRKVGAVVTLGDSITDGFNSTPDTNQRWPDFLSRRLNAKKGAGKMAVLNQGISGNRLLHDIFGPDALARYDRDVLAQTGVTHVVVLEGINDIGLPGVFAPATETVSADDIITGLQQLIERAHAKGLKIFGGTLTPFEGTIFPGYFTPEKEVKRQAVNLWIRSSGAFDAVIDFDRATRDPSQPTRLLPAYDSGDHLHPNDAGYKAMADFVDLSLFREHGDD
jgi:lysophospholipase L1-like esterase